MNHITSGIVSEGIVDFKNLRPDTLVQATTAGTYTASATSNSFYIFTGTAAGQIFKLPNATTLSVGHVYTIMNSSTQPISIVNDGSVSQVTLSPNRTVWLFLRDNTTANGIWTLFQGGTSTPSGRSITLSFPSASGQAQPEFRTNSTTLAPAARFIFQGSTAIGTPVSLKLALFVQAAGTTGTFQLVDLTNASNLIASTTFTSTSTTNVQELTTFTNVPTGEAVFEIQMNSSASNRYVAISSLIMVMA